MQAIKIVSSLYVLFLMQIIIINNIYSLMEEDTIIDVKEQKEILYNNKSSLQILSSPETLTMNYWKTPIIFDYDNNGFPDVISSDLMISESLKGLYRHQMTSSKDWVSVKINSIKYFEHFANLSGSASFDFLNHTEEENVFDLVLSELNDQGIVTNKYIYDTNGEIEDIVIDDIDSDGDNDIIFGYHTGYVQVYQNLGNGSFNPDWDQGIPDKEKNPLLPNLFTRQIKIGDINNDGLQDICTAMRAVSWSAPNSITIYYNWISMGNGTWKECSRDFPIGERVLDIDLADIDNDGDLDYGVLTETNGYLIENIDGKYWIYRKFPNYNMHFSSFTFNDINMDGFQDIITIDSEWHPDYSFTGKVNISFGSGNFSWRTINQFITNYGPYNKPIIEDFDKDGDKDVLFESFGYLLFSENTLLKINNMSFTKTPITTHFSSGYLTQFSWTMRDGYLLSANTANLTFNLSISYTGPEGPFFHLRTVKGRWWTDVIIPDFSSNDVYFRINYSSYSALSGPYTIHGRDGLCSFIEMTYPEYGSYLMEGERVNVTFRTSENLPSGSYPVYLVSGEDRIYVGSYRFESGVNNTFSLLVPWGFNSSYSRFEVRIDWHGQRRDIDTVSRIGVVLRDSVPSRFGKSDHIVPSGYRTAIHVPVLSLNGTDISRFCEYEIENFTQGMSVTMLGGGTFNVTCPDEGDYYFTLRASRYMWSVEDLIHVRSVPPVDSVLLMTQETDPRVGEPFDVLIRGYDPEGKIIAIPQDCVDWEVSGDCGFEVIGGGVRIISFSSGLISVWAEVDVGLGPVEGHLDVMAGSRLTGIRYVGWNDEIMNGTFGVYEISPITYDGRSVEDYSVDWSGSSNVVLHPIEGGSVRVEALREGTADISVVVRYFNESVSGSRSVKVIPAPGDIRIDRDIVVELGSTSGFGIEYLSTSGDPYLGEYELSYEVEDPAVISASISGNELMVCGEMEGFTSIILNLTTDAGVFVERSFPVEVRSTPVSIRVSGVPDLVFVGDELELELIVIDYRGDAVVGFEVEIESERCSVLLVDSNHLILIPGSSGLDEITVEVEKYGRVLMYSFDLEIIPCAGELVIGSSRTDVPSGESVDLSVELLDVDGVQILWSDYLVDVPAGVKYVFDGVGNFTLSFPGRGLYNIRVWVDYHGIVLDDWVNVTVYEPSVLSDVLILRDSRYVEVLCVDQFGENITGMCEIVWSGEFDPVEFFKVNVRSDHIVVNVTYNGTSLARMVCIDSTDHGKYQLDPFIFLFLGLAIMLVSGLVLIYLLVLRKGGRGPEAEPDNVAPSKMFENTGSVGFQDGPGPD